MSEPPGQLSERQRAMLELERTWWQLDTPRADLIRARFGCSGDDYDAELNRVLELPEALAHDPVLVRRFHRRRLRRRRHLLGGGPVTAADGREDSPAETRGGAHP